MFLLVDCCLSPSDFDICQRMGRIRKNTGFVPVDCSLWMSVGPKMAFVPFRGSLPQYGAPEGVISTPKSSFKGQNPFWPHK